MTSLASSSIELPEELQELMDQLDPHARDHFAITILNTVRDPEGGGDALAHTLNSWRMTMAVQRHPQFERQAKEYQNLLESGELLAGISESA